MGIEISHTDEAGTLLEGTERGDGVAELIKPLGWRWSGKLDAWYIRGSRNHAPRRSTIDQTAAALRQAGHEVEVSVVAAGDTAARQERITARQQARAARLTERAEREEGRAEARSEASDRLTGGYPMGQPILVGHHSEGRHRRALDRAEAHERAAAGHRENAKLAREQAREAAAGPGARFNPHTVARRVEKLEADQRRLTRSLAERVRASVRDDLEQVENDLSYWRDVRAGQIADGTATNYGPQNVEVGDAVRIWGTWYRVARVNPKTVKIEGTPGMDNKAPWYLVEDHRPASA